MNKIVIASIFTITSVLVMQSAMADYDPLGSALIGGVAGAVIGHAVGGRHGAVVGAAIGGVGGAVLSANQPRYYDRTQVVYNQPAPVTYYQGYSQYQPVREVVYPVRQVVYYGDDDHRYYHDHDWRGYEHDHGWHRGWDHDGNEHHGWGHDDDEERGYGRY